MIELRKRGEYRYGKNSKNDKWNRTYIRVYAEMRVLLFITGKLCE